MAQSRDYPPNVPNGWKAVFDEQYQTWYYVDLRTNKSQWEPPRGTTWPTPQNYGPPSGPPNGPPGGRPMYGGGPQPQGYPQQPQVQRYQTQPVYYQQAQPVYVQQPIQQPTSHSHKSGMGSGLLGAGAGLLGGMLLADALRPEDNIYEINDNGGPGFGGFGDFGPGGFGGPGGPGFDGFGGPGDFGGPGGFF